MEELSALVVAAQNGDHEAFAKIVARFQNMAYAGAYAMLGNACLAQDAAQEAFIDAYLSLGNLREPAAFPGQYVKIEDTLRGCRAILDGEYDSLPEEAFYFIGPIDQAVKKAEQLQ